MKKPPKPRAAAGRPQPTSAEALLAAARRHAESGHFREAIADYKSLLRVEDRPDWRTALADAYAGRAGELADKGMDKEALTVWENRAQVAPELPPEPAYFALLLRLGRAAEVADAAIRGADRLDPALLASLRSRLAAHWLAGDSALGAHLPADDPILSQGPAASRALDAYCAGDDEALRDAVAALPFRSPYRDLAQLLKALQRLSADPAEAAALLGRIPDDSGFAPLRRAAERVLGGSAGLVERLAGVSEPAARFALALAGWGQTRQAVLLDYRRLGEPGPKSLLRLLHRHRAMLGERWARRQALRLLTPGFPKSLAWMTECGWRRLDEEERRLVAAWRSEDRREPWLEVEAWDDYAEHLLAQGEPAPGSDAAMEVALVLRRVDNHRQILGDLAPSGAPHDSDLEIARSVERSLRFDPDHAETYERLARFSLHGKDLKAARQTIDRGLKRFPEHPGLLTAALDLALASDSFKKATRYAREILRLDPIHRGARDRLVKAHLSHGAKQIRLGRLDLAAKELEQAAEWDQGARHRERREILAGLIELSLHPAKGQAILSERLRALGVGLPAAFALAREASAIGRPPAAVLKAAGMSKVPVPSQSDLVAFLARLRTHLDEGEGLAPDLRRLFEPPLKAAARWPLPQPELEGACETLRRAGLSAARRAFAEAGLKRWPGMPIFELHRYESLHPEGWRGEPTVAEVERLDQAWQRARDAGDVRTAHRLSQILRGADPFSFLPDPAGIFDLADDEDGLAGPSPASPLDAMLDMIQDIGLDRILEMAGASPAERRRFKELEREFGREAVMEQLIEFMLEHPPPLPTDFQPPPGSGPRRRGGPRRPSAKTVEKEPANGYDDAPPTGHAPKGAGKRASDSDPDDQPPEQLDLFQ